MVLSSKAEKHILEINRQILVLKNGAFFHAGKLVTKKKDIVCCLTDHGTQYKEKINASWKLESSTFRKSLKSMILPNCFNCCRTSVEDLYNNWVSVSPMTASKITDSLLFILCGTNDDKDYVGYYISNNFGNIWFCLVIYPHRETGLSLSRCICEAGELINSL